jgi:hypothetical protein
LPNDEQLDELYNSMKSKSEGVSFEDVSSRMAEVNEVVSEVIKIPKEVELVTKSDEKDLEERQ